MGGDEAKSLLDKVQYPPHAAHEPRPLRKRRIEFWDRTGQSETTIVYQLIDVFNAPDEFAPGQGGR
jgi:hypothetical protein